MKDVNKILFPCDLSEAVSKISSYVVALADAWKSGIYVLHVVHDLHKWGKVYIPHASVDLFQQEATETAEKAIHQVCEEHLEGQEILAKKVVSGDPATEILKTIEYEGIDMVVMGTHGRKGLEQIFMGSVAQHVVRNAPVPVMTINPDKIK